MSSGAGAACKAPAPSEAQPPLPEIRFAEVHFRVYREGRLTAAGEAGSVAYRRDSGDLAAEAVAVSFPEAGDGETPRLVAARARGNSRTRAFLAEGGVRVQQGPDEAVTEEARYDPGERLIRGDRPTTLRGPGWALTGPGFLLDPAAKRLELGEGVRLDVADARTGTIP